MNELKRATESTVAVAVTVTKLLGPSPLRRAILVSARGADVYISASVGVTVGGGIRITAGVEPVDICSCHYGDWLTRDLYAIADGGAATVFVLEGFQPNHDEEK